MQEDLTDGWHTIEAGLGEGKHRVLARSFRFSNYEETMQFVNKVAQTAERLQHHPEMVVKWGEVLVLTWTHSENAITDKDHELTREIDQL